MAMQGNKMTKLRHVVLGRLESLQQAGVLQIPRVWEVPIPAGQPAQARLEPAPAETAPEPRATAPLGPVQMEVPMAKKPDWSSNGATALFEAPGALTQPVPTDLSLNVIQEEVAECRRCAELANTRTQTVFGVGNPNARLCFLGEAPGADEDRLGEPFVGRGGQLVNKIIEACRIKREDVYILNMIKCRPPGNRNPLPTELANCRGYLDRHLAFTRP
jgi:DNA polymerase